MTSEAVLVEGKAMRHALPHPNAACCIAIFCSLAALVMLVGLLLAAIAE